MNRNRQSSNKGEIAVKKILTLTLLGIVISGCGGGGGGGGTPPAGPKVSVSGPSTVWSDDYEWSAKATASGMDLSTVAFSMSGGDEYIEIDSITGEINSSDYNVDIGSHRFTIRATDASGATASTTYSLRSDAFIAGIWRTNDTDYGDYYELLVTRTGKVLSTFWTNYNDDFEQCFGSFAVMGRDLNGEIECNSYIDGVDADFSADLQGTSDGDIILNKMSITSGQYAGEVLNGQVRFYRESSGVANISPGIYVHFSDWFGYMELKVNTNGSFNTLSSEEAVINIGDISTCQVRGNIIADPIYGLATAPEYSNYSIDVHDSTLTATGCTSDYNQSNADAVAVPIVYQDNSTPSLFFGTSGNPDSNDNYNATSDPVFVQVCDEQNQPTTFAFAIGASCGP